MLSFLQQLLTSPGVSSLGEDGQVAPGSQSMTPEHTGDGLRRPVALLATAFLQALDGIVR